MRLAAFLSLVAVMPTLTEAASVTYNFSYSGANISLPDATAMGTGSFTVDYFDVGPQPPTALTGFSFVLTLTTSGPQSESSVFVYSLADVPLNPGVILGGTTSKPIPFQIAVVTRAVTGTDPLFGSVAADLNMLPSGGSVLTQGFSGLANTSGPAVWTSIVYAPEPSTVGLLALAALVMAAWRLVRLQSQ